MSETIPEVTGDIHEIAANARAMIAPPIDVLPYRAVAEQIRFPDGPKVGQIYDPDLDPVHAAIISVLENSDFTRHVWVGAVQTGKSLIMTLTMMRVVTQLKQSLVYSQPTMSKLNEAWVGKIWPIIQSSAYANWIPKTGQGSKGGQHLSFVQFREPATKTRAGISYFIPGGGNKEAAQAGTTAAWIFNDEVDSYSSRHRIELIAKRADSFGRHARRIYTSTVKDDESSIILGMYDESTRSRLHFKCPHCGEWMPLEWENIKYDGADEISAASSVRYAAPCCGVLWTEGDRAQAHQQWRIVHYGQKVEKDGTVTGDVPRTLTFGILWTGLDSTIRALSVMAGEHFRATKALENGDHGPMRSFCRDQLCRMYSGETEEMETFGLLNWQKLHQRTTREKWGPYRAVSDRDPAEPDHYLYSRHICEPPPEASHSVLAIDVQANRLYWIIRAFNMDRTSWVCGYGYEYSRKDHDSHNEAELHQVLDRIAAAAPGYVGNTNLVLGGVDVGDNTDMVRRWIDARKGIFKAVKGHTNTMKAEPGDVEGLAYWRDGIFLMQADNARDMFHATFRRPLDAIGATHIANGLGSQDASLFRHIVSEQATIDPDTKKKVVVRGSGRNDWLDCCKMTEVLIYGFTQDQRAYEVKTPMPVRSETKALAEQDNRPQRVGHALQTNRPRFDMEGNSGMHRVNRRSSRMMR